MLPTLINSNYQPGQCSGCVWVGISNQDRLSGLAAFRSSKSPGGSHYMLLKWVTRRCYTRDCRLSCLLITGRLPWQPAGIKFTHCVSGHKSAFSPLQEKLCVGSKNDWHLLELSRRPLSACKIWGDRTKRAGCRSENWCILYVTLGLPALGWHSSNNYCVTVYW